MNNNQDVSQMQYFKAIMGDDDAALRQSYDTVKESSTFSGTSYSPIHDDQMAKFLSIVDDEDQTDDSSGGQIITEENSNSFSNIIDTKEKRRALMTESVDSGVKVGKWVIKELLHESANGKNTKTYDIKHNKTGQTILSDLYLYNAALGIVNLLNEGFALNSSSAKHILDLEEKFVSRRNDAMNYKRRYVKEKKLGNSAKASIYETKYYDAVDKARFFRKQINNITDDI